MKFNKDGEDKSIEVILDCLGSVKQAPYLIEEIVNVLPKINIYMNITSLKDTINSKKFEKLFYNDLEKLNYKLRNNIEKKCSKNKDLAISIDIDKSLYNPKSIHFHIDPLKFEKRNLLEESSKLELKKKYNITNEKVVVIGSPRSDELPLILNSAKEILKKDLEEEIRFLVVPRNENNDYSYKCFFMREICEREMNEPGLYEEKSCEKEVRFSEADVHEKGSGIECITETGILENIYSIADIAIIGNTFYKDGWGQNPLEPVFYGVRCLSGKYWRHNDDAFEGLKKSKLLKIITGSEKGMQKKLQKEIISNISKNKLIKYRDNAQKFIEENQGAAKEYARIVQEYLYSN